MGSCAVDWCLHWERLIAASLIGRWMDTGQPNPLPPHFTMQRIHCFVLQISKAWGVSRWDNLALEVVQRRYCK